MWTQRSHHVTKDTQYTLRIGVFAAVVALLVSGLTLGAGSSAQARDPGSPPLLATQVAVGEAAPDEAVVDQTGPGSDATGTNHSDTGADAVGPDTAVTDAVEVGAAEDPASTPAPGQPEADQPEADQPEQPEQTEPSGSPTRDAVEVSGEPGMQELTLEVVTQASAATGETNVEKSDLNLGFLWNQDETPVWDLKRKGVEIDASGFNPNEALTVTVGGGAPAPAKADAGGNFNVILRATASPGTYTVKLTAASGTQTDDLTVFKDSQWWAGFDDVPSASGDWRVMTAAGVSATGNEFYVTEFPYDTYVDLYVNGTFTKSIYHPYFFKYLLKGTFRAGTVTIEFRHPVKTVKTSMTVVPNTAGTRPKPGAYFGTSTQTHASDVPLESRSSRAFGFTVDGRGYVTGLTGTFWWSCVTGGGFHGSGFSDFRDSTFPATRITRDRPFEVQWRDTSMSYSFSGIVRANGTASGRLWASLGACGSSQLTWKTALTGQAFVDVPKTQKFYQPIQWMFASGLSTGTRKDGVRYYFPKSGVTREAMAAFLYRLSGSPTFTPPRTSPFADLNSRSKFYKEITWLAKTGITTGVRQSSGKPKFLPKGTVTREAMAAFLYRFEGKPKFAPPRTSPFADLGRGGKFYKEITWLAKTGITTGVKQPSGKPHYQPKSRVTREAMAAFIYRLEN